MTQTKDLVDVSKLNAVISHIVSGRASTVKDACELAGVPTSTFYAMQKRGQVDEIIGQALQGLRDDMALLLAHELPEIAKDIATIAKNKDASNRERVNAFRALLMADKVLGTAPAAPDSEKAGDWLQRQGSRFQPMQVNVAGNLVITGPEPGVVEGEVRELADEPALNEGD